MAVALAAFILVGFAGFAKAQTPSERGPGPRQERPDLFKALGLSEEQIGQIRAENEEMRPKMQEATRRMREANRELDRAIYADTLDEAAVAARLGEYKAAQAEMAALRFQSELALRRILSPEQLVKFRELRQRFTRQREDAQRERQESRPQHQPPPNPN